VDIFRREDLHHLYLFYHVAKEGDLPVRGQAGACPVSISRSISMLEKVLICSYW
jgi:hypothetical protein